MRRLVRKRQAGDDAGSMVLALVVILMTGTIITGLSVVMINGQTQSRFDQNYTNALHGADAGLQQALFQANSGKTPTTSCTSAAPCLDGDVKFWWSTATTTNGWTVTSVGQRGAVKRTVVADVVKAPRFFLAAFGDKEIELKGSNGADSYNHLTGATDTGNGALGSNGDVNMDGASTHADLVDLYNHDTAHNTCTQSGNGDGCDNVATVGPKLDLASDQNMQFINDQLAACASVETLPDWVASANSGTIAPRGFGVPWCFNTLTFDVNTTVTGTDANPVVIFVKGQIDIGQGINVNCGTCSNTPATPTASNLLIYSAGSTDTESVGIGNQSKFAGAIYAPRAGCLGNPSAAQADIYGALICGSIGRITSGNQGGWSFHFDDALTSIGTGGYRITRWDEK
ncbi:MAG TPA: hypothetical protein VFQ85_17755 [Mycobacteriales bacterium]|jgi:hypothetical protein|nr:hypothetical protein [Mycobacteriales bacterium]